ncbi:MAG: type II toxin-antitoxin system RelE/ParE family toxin [Flavobacteriales bacterium]
MALKIIWTAQAEKGLADVLLFLDENWTATEILNLKQNIITLLGRISQYPKICPPTGRYNNLHKGLVDKNNYIIYRVQTKKGLIEVINFRSTRQKPLT